jgi:hypothetical protein
MSQRDTNILWLKDLLGHLENCQRQLEWAEDSCRRICESLRRRLEPATV